MQDTPQNRQKLSAVVAQAWMNEAYKQTLLTSPNATLTAAGVSIDEGVVVRVVEDTDTLKNIVLDSHPLPADKTVEQLPANPTFYQVYAYIYTKCIEDPAFKESFLADPAGVVKSLGYDLPDFYTIAVHQNTDTVRYFVLPVPPKMAINTQSLQNEVEMFATDPVNANVNANANANVNVNGDVNINGALQVNGAAVATVVVAVAVLI